MRYYLSTLAGTGTAADPFTPVAPLDGIPWSAVDLRPSPGAAAGEYLLMCDPTPAQHAALAATVGVTYLPFESALGANVSDSTLAAVSAANRTILRSIADARSIVANDFTLADSCRRVVRRFIRRAILRQLLGGDDWTEGLDTLISAMTAARRQAIRARLDALGFDTSVLTLGMTVREGIQAIGRQRLSLLAVDNGFDD